MIPRALLLAAAAVAALPATAQADISFPGGTGQGFGLKLVAEDNGIVKRVAIGWRASCRRPGYRITESTTFRTPLELASARSLRDGGSYTKAGGHGYRLTVHPRISGRKVGPRRWAGRFRATVVVRRGGEVRDRCSVRGVRWRARRRG
jgi:hypothetical protein